jgi:hypothetical protein
MRQVCWCPAGVLRMQLPPPPRCDTRVNRRSLLRVAGALLLGHVAQSGAGRAGPAPDTSAEWPPESLCRACRGRGTQPCALCNGSGIFAVDDGFVTPYKTTCPNCGGAGHLRCPKCIGLGLADTRGILRDGTLAPNRFRHSRYWRNLSATKKLAPAPPSLSFHSFLSFTSCRRENGNIFVIDDGKPADKPLSSFLS